MGVDWRKSVEQACERLVEFLGTCALDVQGVQSMQFALADFEAELSMKRSDSPRCESRDFTR